MQPGPARRRIPLGRELGLRTPSLSGGLSDPYGRHRLAEGQLSAGPLLFNLINKNGLLSDDIRNSRMSGYLAISFTAHLYSALPLKEKSECDLPLQSRNGDVRTSTRTSPNPQGRSLRDDIGDSSMSGNLAVSLPTMLTLPKEKSRNDTSLARLS